MEEKGLSRNRMMRTKKRKKLNAENRLGSRCEWHLLLVLSFILCASVSLWLISSGFPNSLKKANWGWPKSARYL